MTRDYPPISSYALLGDCRSAALVGRDGSVDWCCFPRFDSRPVFARILDRERGGHFAIAPAGPYTVERRYLPGTNVLETRFGTPSGVMTLTDCLALSAGDAPTHPRAHHQLLRRIRVESGEVEVAVEVAPRFDYGLTTARMELRDAHGAIVYGGADGLVLQSDVPLRPASDCACHSRTPLRAGDERWLAVTYRAPHQLRRRRVAPAELARRLDATVRFWAEWSAGCRYDGPHREAVVRSALVLKALTYAPTGAIVAAPTTSLPEAVGGVRNWDYRFVWLRDAALNLWALFTLGHRAEAHAFMGWVKRTTAGRAAELQIMYGVGGERLLPEVELEGVDGHRGSRPVRIGNDAARQKQHDAYGFLLDTAWLYHRYGGRIEPAFWELLRAAADHVARVWTVPDHGIWEMRDGPRHFVLSKAMCWVTLDRAARLARALRLPGDVGGWEAAAAAIRAEVEREGVDPVTGGFAQAYGSDVVDAANLLLPLVRFVSARDPRMRATVAAVEERLRTGDLVQRYLAPDGLPGAEATFAICTFWLVDNLALGGEVERAEALFEGICARANDVGLLAEEVDGATGELLGNFPQAFSHVGMIEAAMNLLWARTRSRAGRPPRPR